LAVEGNTQSKRAKARGGGVCNAQDGSAKSHQGSPHNAAQDRAAHKEGRTRARYPSELSLFRVMAMVGGGQIGKSPIDKLGGYGGFFRA